MSWILHRDRNSPKPSDDCCISVLDVVLYGAADKCTYSCTLNL